MKLVAYIAGVDSIGAGKMRYSEELDDLDYVIDPEKAISKMKKAFVNKYGSNWSKATRDRFMDSLAVQTETETNRERLLFARKLFEKFPMRLDAIEKAYPEIAVPVKGWDEKHLRWLVDRIDEYSNKKLADEFYRKFGVKKTVPAMRDMKLRMRGMKPYGGREY